MDKEVLKRRMTERFQQRLDEAIVAVEQAPDGQVIAASEWQVREVVFQKADGRDIRRAGPGPHRAAPGRLAGGFFPRRVGKERWLRNKGERRLRVADGGGASWS